MFGGKFGAIELIVILIIVLVIFGPKQLPKLSRMFGNTVKNFREGMEEDLEEGGEKKTAAVKAEASDPADAPEKTE